MNQNIISYDEYVYLLSCLIEGADKVANTASVYEAFLKKFKKSAVKKLIIKPLELTKGKYIGKVYNEDVIC